MMKTMCAKISEFERFEEIDRSKAAEAEEIEIHCCNNCHQAVRTSGENDLYFASGLCKKCRDEVYKEMEEMCQGLTLAELQAENDKLLEKILKQGDRILEQIEAINKTLRGE
jgi:hypothetical protein